MFNKRKFLLALIIFVTSILVSLSAQKADASKGQELDYRPPECSGIRPDEDGYWGMLCYDSESNIVSANLETTGQIIIFEETPSYVEMMVQVEAGDKIGWEVCTISACVGSTP